MPKPDAPRRAEDTARRMLPALPRWQRQRDALIQRGILCQCGHRKHRHEFHDVGLDFCQQCYPQCRRFRPVPPRQP